MAITMTKSYQRIATIGLTYGEIRIYAKYSSQSIANNNTTFQLKSTYYTYQANGVSFSSATGGLDGTTRSYGYTTMPKGETTIIEVSRTQGHNTDGSSITYTVYASWSATFGGGGSTSGQIVFPKINRYATLTSAPDFNDEGNPTINYSNPAGNSSSISSLQVCIASTDGYTQYAPYRDVSKTGTSYTFNLTDTERNALRNAIPNSNTLAVKYYIRTIISGTIYTSTSQKTMTIVNANPTFTHSELETNTTVSDALGSTSADTIVQNLSNVKFTITPSAKKGASITKVELTHNNSTSSDTTSPYEFTIKPVSNSFSVKVTDSRNNTTIQTITKTMLNYAPVKINSFSFRRVNPTSSNIIVNLDATYWNTNVGSVTNAPVVKWKMGSEGTLTTIPSSSVTVDNTNHKITVSNYTLNNQLVYTSGETFYIYVNDAFSSASNNAFVTKGIPVLDLGDNEVEVNGTFKATSDITSNTYIKGNNGFYSRPTGEVATPTSANGMLLVKRASSSEAPNNGVVLEFGNSTSWKGQLYIGDNATQGAYINGWSNGTRGSWKKLAYEDDVKVKLSKITCTKYSGTKAAGSWANMYQTVSSTIEKGTYLIIASGGIKGSANGMITSRLMVDNGEAAPACRATIPLVNGLVSNYVISKTYTFSSTASHSFCVSGYTNAACTIETDLNIDFIKLY